MMYKKFISIIVSIGLIFSAFPTSISAAVSDRSGKGNGENYDVVRLESPQAMASAVAEMKSRKSLKRIRSGRYSDYEEEVRRRARTILPYKFTKHCIIIKIHFRGFVPREK